MDIEEFYSADERRRQSAEIELGTNWFDAAGNRYELSWVEDTGELYTMAEFLPEVDTWTPFGDIEVEAMPADRVLVSVVGSVPRPRLAGGGPRRLAAAHGRAERHRVGGLRAAGPRGAHRAAA